MVEGRLSVLANRLTGFDLSGDLVPTGTTVDPGTFLAPAHALVPFGVFVAAAVWCRRRPAVHKRLMMLALVTTTGAPVAHLIGHWPLAFLIFPVSQIMLLCLLFIHDRLSQGRIHSVSLWGESCRSPGDFYSSA